MRRLHLRDYLDAVYAMMVNERVQIGDTISAAIERVDLVLLPEEESLAKANTRGLKQLVASSPGLGIVGLPEGVEL